ncbi:transcriptional regulator [Methanococcus maripaludis C5]|uniref:Transcriptional regulator n=1 Tax=Methanococcus maripaludis (strain C5 / ATCC BAA-1333) TaxID=402880 RepID=A4FWI2_METM5|nr:winged helix-turn-helix transcriptional regulator [Methanococcus maripaludis]ABO34557.1 transcriptional regulator [Methanococcus maripaludis C5]
MLLELLAKNHVKEILYQLVDGKIEYSSLKKEIKIDNSYLKSILNELESCNLILKHEKRKYLIITKSYYSLTEKGVHSIRLYELEKSLIRKKEGRKIIKEFDIDIPVYYFEDGEMKSFQMIGFGEVEVIE